MKKNWNEQTTNQLILDIKSLQEKHESIKNKMGKKRSLVLIDGYSQYAALVPNEVVLEFY